MEETGEERKKEFFYLQYRCENSATITNSGQQLHTNVCVREN